MAGATPFMVAAVNAGHRFGVADEPVKETAMAP
jgi:hypothetical protein